MAKFELSARACTFTRSPGGVTGRQHKLLDPPIARQNIEVTNCDALAEALAVFRDSVSTDGSYFVSARLTAGRSPAGFKSRTWILEVNRDVV